jgi:hypothetical protein
MPKKRKPKVASTEDTPLTPISSRARQRFRSLTLRGRERGASPARGASANKAHRFLTGFLLIGYTARIVKFFIPATEEPAKAEEVYEAIRTFSIKQMGATLSPRRIYSVSGKHGGKAFTATVGKKFESLGEQVIAILLDTSRSCYLICTPNRGALRGTPYLAGSNEINHSEDFEENDPPTQPGVVN